MEIITSKYSDVLDNGLIIKIRILYKNKEGPWENVQ